MLANKGKAGIEYGEPVLATLDNVTWYKGIYMCDLFGYFGVHVDQIDDIVFFSNIRLTDKNS